jgi:hypothetical protein
MRPHTWTAKTATPEDRSLRAIVVAMTEIEERLADAIIDASFEQIRLRGRVACQRCFLRAFNHAVGALMPYHQQMLTNGLFWDEVEDAVLRAILVECQHLN